MKKIIYTIVLSLVVFATVQAQQPEAALVKQVFNNYKNAILTDKGTQAAAMVDSRTIAYYDKIIGLVKNADSAEVSNLSIVDKLTVLTLRHKAKSQDLKGMDGKKTFIYAIDNGMVGKNSIVDIVLGDVSVGENFAKGQLISKGIKVPLYYHFYKEQGKWKLNLTSIMPLSGAAFKGMIEKSGKSENDFILELLELMTGRKPTNEIWQKVI